MKVPFVDLKTQYAGMKEQIDKAICRVIENTSFIQGRFVTEFEDRFKKECGAKHCIGVGNGTDALYISLKALGIGTGDEVITTACSYISTSETISQAGAVPVFVDIEPLYHTIDTQKIEEKITDNTKAIIPVHLYGQMADIKQITAICQKHGLQLIEDCAQSHFAELNGIKAGQSGILSTFSFYPGKNLGAYGDGGAIITNDDDLAGYIRSFASHGCLVKHIHEREGINSRLDGIQAAILLVKMDYIHEWNRKRLENALLYNDLLSGMDQLRTPQIRKGAKHIFHIYCVRVRNREKLIRFLAENHIDTGIHYPYALPNMPAYNYLGHNPADFPVASAYQDEILSLPMYPELSREQIGFVADKIKEFYS